MNLTEMRTALRTELRDPSALWSNTEIDRAIVKAVADIDRVFPLEAFKEITFKYAITAESWTAAATAGTWVQLANKPITWASEAVKDATGAVCTRDTDYSMDYISGKITHISGGKISNAEVCTISYSKSKIAIDVSALSIIRIQRVEYPYGQVPQMFSSYDFFADMLWLTGVESEQQANLTEKKHIVIMYLTKNTAPTADAVGSYPRHLDEIVAKGAAAYCCFIKALQYEHAAATAQGSISHSLTGTALGNASGMLGKIEAYLTASVAPSAKKYLDDGDAIVAAINAATWLTGDTAPSAKKYLDDGDAYILTINIADNVPEKFASYAQRCIEISAGLAGQADMYATYAGRSAEIALNLIRAAAEYDNEAANRLGEIDRYLAEAGQNLALADRWHTEGTDRRNEFLAILVDRAQLAGRVVSQASPRQVRA